MLLLRQVQPVLILVPLYHGAVALVKDFFAYLWDMFCHWEVLVTGGGAVALMTAYERIRKPLPPQVVRWIILVCFGFLAGFSAWRDAYLSMKGREADVRDLQGKLRTAQAGFGQPRIEVNVPPPTVITQLGERAPQGYLTMGAIAVPSRYSLLETGKPMAFNFAAKNPGPGTVYRPLARTYYLLDKNPGPSSDTSMRAKMNALVQSLKKEYPAQKLLIPELPSGQEVWGTTFVPAFAAPQEQLFLDGRLRVYFVSIYLWNDRTRTVGSSTDCRWLQPPALGAPGPQELIWHYCTL